MRILGRYPWTDVDSKFQNPHISDINISTVILALKICNSCFTDLCAALFNFTARLFLFSKILWHVCSK